MSRGLKTLILFTLCFYDLGISGAFSQVSNKEQNQTHNILKGKVTDTQNKPLPGATITDTQNQKTAQTGSDGTFSLTTTTPTGKVTISYLGYQSQTINYTTDKPLSVQLQEDRSQLQAVEINTGYYSVQQKLSTGSISSLKAKDIEKQPISNPLLSLAGRVTGAYVTQTSGTPGSAVNLLIRGQQSIDAGTQPLYLVDGIPFGSQTLSSSSSASAAAFPLGGTSPFSTLAPEDIESIEILKDADATAIYGSRGANGVVLISTKKGRSGKPKIELNSYSGYHQLAKKIKLLNTAQFSSLRKKALELDGLSAPRPADHDLNGTWNPSAQTDWQERLLGGKAPLHNNTLSISGGNQTSQFYLSAARQSQGTITPGEHRYARSSAHLSGSLASGDQKFRASASVSYASDNTSWFNSDLSFQALTLAPNAPEIYQTDGRLNWANSTWTNPLAILAYRYLAKNTTLTASAQLSYRPVQGLELSARLGHSTASLKDNGFTPASTYDPAYGVTPEYSTSDVNQSTSSTYSAEPQASYQKNTPLGNFSILAGLSIQRQLRQQLLLRGTGFSSDALIENLQAATSTAVRGQTATDYAHMGSYGRIGYVLKDRYILNLTARRDGSSRFGPDKRFASFGAMGLAYLASQTKFIQEKLPLISLLKIRGSYGSSGNDQIGDYEYLDSYQSGTGYGGAQGLAPVRLYNPAFGWETTTKLEVALEFGLFKDRISGSIGHYRNRSSSQLINYPLAATAGFQSIRNNLPALVQNTGLEASLSAQLRKGTFNWQASANFTLPKNKLVSFPGLANSSYAGQYLIGQPLSIAKTYELLGVNPSTGIYQFRDFNGDGLISSPNDRQKVVQRGIRYYGGLDNNLSYKNLELSFLIQFVSQRASSYRAQLTFSPGRTNNQPLEDLDRYWTTPGQTAVLQRPTSGANAAAVAASALYAQSDATITDASFARLKNLSVAYRTTSLLPASTLRIYLQGQNLYTLTRYFGLDPETATLITPPLRTITLGLQLIL